MPHPNPHPNLHPNPKPLQKHLEADYINMTKVTSVSDTKVVPLPAALKLTQDGDEDDK